MALEVVAIYRTLPPVARSVAVGRDNPLEPVF